MKVFLFILIFSYSFNLFGQSSDEEQRILYRLENNYSIYFHSSGYGINYSNFWYKTGYKQYLLDLDFSIFKDAKEIRRFHPINFDEAKGYRYGKLNSLSILRIGLGQQIVKHDKADKKSIYLRTIKSFGLSLGLAKPVYLKIIDSISDNMIYISDKRYDPYNHGVDNIYGRSSLLKGFSKISPYPGVFFKYALNIDYGDRQQEVKTIEAGVVLDFYFKELDIMAFNDNKNYLLNFYLKFGIGNRWNKK